MALLLFWSNQYKIKNNLKFIFVIILVVQSTLGRCWRSKTNETFSNGHCDFLILLSILNDPIVRGWSWVKPLIISSSFALFSLLCYVPRGYHLFTSLSLSLLCSCVPVFVPHIVYIPIDILANGEENKTIEWTPFSSLFASSNKSPQKSTCNRKLDFIARTRMYLEIQSSFAFFNSSATHSCSSCLSIRLSKLFIYVLSECDVRFVGNSFH